MSAAEARRAKGRELAEIIRSRGLTQQAVADMTAQYGEPVTLRSIGSMLRGQTAAQEKTLSTIAAVLDVEPEALQAKQEGRSRFVVMTPRGDVSYHFATVWEVNDRGDLIFMEDDEDLVFAYASGHWATVQREALS